MNKYTIGVLVSVAAASAFLSSGGARTLLDTSVKSTNAGPDTPAGVAAPKPAGQTRR